MPDFMLLQLPGPSQLSLLFPPVRAGLVWLTMAPPFSLGLDTSVRNCNHWRYISVCQWPVLEGDRYVIVLSNVPIRVEIKTIHTYCRAWYTIPSSCGWKYLRSWWEYLFSRHHVSYRRDSGYLHPCSYPSLDTLTRTLILVRPISGTASKLILHYREREREREKLYRLHIAHILHIIERSCSRKKL